MGKIIIGGRTPSFVHLDSNKVVEIVEDNCSKDEIEGIVFHYRQFGYECIVIKSSQCYDWNKLDEVFGVKK